MSTPPDPATAKVPARQRILDAAEAHFATAGFAGARVAEIAASAGVSKAHLYYHFPSKAALLAAVIEVRTAEIVAAADTLMRSSPVVGADPESRVQLLGSVIDQILRPRRAFIRVALLESLRDPESTRALFAAVNAALDAAQARPGYPSHGGARDVSMLGLLSALFCVAVDDPDSDLPTDTPRLAAALAHLATSDAPPRTDAARTGSDRG